MKTKKEQEEEGALSDGGSVYGSNESSADLDGPNVLLVDQFEKFPEYLEISVE